jgi:hypothetical protein
VRSTRRRIETGLAWGLIFSMIAFFSPGIMAAGSGSVSGIVIERESGSPLEGAVIHLLDPNSDEAHASAPTNGEGSFNLDRIPPKSYALVIETEEGAFVAGTPLTVDSGEPQTIQVAVTREAADDTADVGGGGGKNKKKKKKKRGGGIMKHPGLAAIITIGGATIVGYGLKKATEEDPLPVASPSQPN